ncbi:hypothetical protein SCLCIDRAFT_34657 [Scleroderma citrinum Foug A]|uniref:Uncharacterized protein n=1 Tax=Scleroderma citrinum Foug A TaxID=1036808 RepID=A0A0C2YK33_9AGAM|nr:hypothetical protein SCLCIDRAFT_34657 [Scleroderma citrinum Foug A]
MYRRLRRTRHCRRRSSAADQPSVNIAQPPSKSASRTLVIVWDVANRLVSRTMNHHERLIIPLQHL